MKTLQEHITEINNYETQDLENILLTHLYNHLLIDSYNIEYHPSEIIFESLGKFNKCGQVAEYIFSELYKTNDSITLDCRKFKVFFDYVSIALYKGHNQIYAEYNKQENRILYINIYLQTVDYSIYDNLIILILHEMMHAYEDKQRIKTGKPSIFNLLDDKYSGSLKLLKTNNEISNTIGKLNYFLNDQEQNAYFGTLYTTVENIIKTKNISLDNIDYTNIIKNIKQENIWKIYFDLCKFIIKLNNNELNEKNINQIQEIYKYIFKSNQTLSSIKKELNNKWDKFYKKFNELVPKIICEIIVNNSSKKRKHIDCIK